MPQWAKIKFFYETMLGSIGGTLSATSTASDCDVKNIYNMLEVNRWKAANIGDQTITYDAGAGNSRTADYLAIIGHNLNQANVTVKLQWSDNGSAWTDVFPAEAVSSSKVYLKEFTVASAHRYWRLSITGLTTSDPYEMAICIWGLKTELDYATASFDPHGQEAKANINLSQGGYVSGIHTKYTERQMTLTFHDADSTLYGKINSWWETSSIKNFFVAWETSNNPNDIFLMRPDAKFSNPLTKGGLYRDITLSLTGRKE